MRYGHIHIRIIRAAVAVMAAVAVFAGIDVTVTPDSVTVGDVIAMNVAIGVPKNARVVAPETEKGFGDFFVLSQDSSFAEGIDADTARYLYSLATFKPRNCTIPSIRFLVGVDTLFDTLDTDPVPITVTSVIPEDAPDSVLTIKDLKAQQRTGGADVRYLWVLLVIAAAVLIYHILGKYARKRGADEPATVNLKPPYEEAVEAIAELKAKRYPEQGMAREYAFELSEIFKRYIGRRYDTIASELTTSEIVDWLEFADISVDMRLCAERFFRDCDKVKFAKWVPNRLTLDEFMEDVRTFIEATKPDPELQYELKTERMAPVE